MLYDAEKIKLAVDEPLTSETKPVSLSAKVKLKVIY